MNPQSAIGHPQSDCQGGELNSRPRAYESPALPLSYPGVDRVFNCAAVLGQTTNPECFRGCSTAELPWREHKELIERERLSMQPKPPSRIHSRSQSFLAT